jgi:hypothetical protein
MSIHGSAVTHNNSNHVLCDFRKANRILLEGVKNFTIMVKNSIEFPKCGEGLRKRNFLDTMTKTHLRRCIYNKKSDPTCPIFRIGDIVEWSGQNFSDVAQTVHKIGVAEYMLIVVWLNSHSHVYITVYIFPGGCIPNYSCMGMRYRLGTINTGLYAHL